MTSRGLSERARGNALDLGDDIAAGVLGGHGDCQHLDGERLLLHREVAVDVRRGGPDDADIDRERLVEQVFLAVDRHQLDQVLLRPLVQLAAAVARVDVGTEAHVSQGSRFARGDVAEQVADHALRQVVTLDVIPEHELLQLRDKAPVSADHASDQPFVSEVVEPPFASIALPSRIHERESAGPALGLLALLLLLEKVLLERNRDPLGKSDADKSPRRHRVPIVNEPHRLFGSLYLGPLFHRAARKNRTRLLRVAHLLSSFNPRSFSRAPRARRRGPAAPPGP